MWGTKYFRTGITVLGALFLSLASCTGKNDGSQRVIQYTDVAPIITNLAISPSNPKTLDTLVAVASSNNIETDPVVLSYVWYVNGFEKSTTSTLNYDQFKKEDIIKLKAIACDNYTCGFSKSISSIIENSPPKIELSYADFFTHIKSPFSFSTVQDDDGIDDISVYSVDLNSNSIDDFNTFQNIFYSQPGFFSSYLFLEDKSGITDTTTVDARVSDYQNSTDIRDELEDFFDNFSTDDKYDKISYDSLDISFWQDIKSRLTTKISSLDKFEKENASGNNYDITSVYLADIGDKGVVIYELSSIPEGRYVNSINGDVYIEILISRSEYNDLKDKIDNPF